MTAHASVGAAEIESVPVRRAGVDWTLTMFRAPAVGWPDRWAFTVRLDWTAGRVTREYAHTHLSTAVEVANPALVRLTWVVSVMHVFALADAAVRRGQVHA